MLKGLQHPSEWPLIMKKGKLVDWYFMLGANFNMDLESFSSEIMMGTEWAMELLNAIADLVASGGESLKKTRHCQNGELHQQCVHCRRSDRVH